MATAMPVYPSSARPLPGQIALPTLTASAVGCRRCPLSKTRTTIVDGVGPVPAKLMVVGEAPGEWEDTQGVPFVGNSGKLLRAALAELGWPGYATWFTNAVRCRPPSNRDPELVEMAECRSWLQEEIYLVRPEVILAVGVKAAEQLTHLDTAGAIPFLAWHPAYVLRQSSKRNLWRDQLREAILALSDPPAMAPASTPHPVEPTFLCGTPLASAPWLSADTETDDLEEGLGVRRVAWTLSDGVTGEFSEAPPPRFGHLFLHNAKYDLPLLDIPARDLHRWDDTMLMAYVLRHPRVGLKELAPELTGIKMDAITTILGTKAKKNKRSFSEALASPDRSKAIAYATKDAIVTARLAQRLWEELEEAPRLLAYYQDIEKPLVPILLEMEQRGVLIDRAALTPLGEYLGEQIDAHTLAVREALGQPTTWNPYSNDQLAPVLEAHGFRFPGRTETGKVKIDKAALLASVAASSVADLDPENGQEWLIGQILEGRACRKLKTTYVDTLGRLAGADPEGRVHARFNQAVTDTNRLSSSEPNLQNIPARTELGRKIRDAFVARPGYTIVKADYSQLEVRIYAHYTQEPALLASYPLAGDERDVHQSVADELGIARKDAKNVLFAAVYGAAADKLARTAGVPLSESAPFLARMRERLPSLLTWQTRNANLLTRQGYVETLLGWRNYYPQFWSPIRSEQRAALREASNLPIQGTAAGLVKVLMIDADDLAREKGAELLLQVHDEVVYEVPDAEVRDFAGWLGALGAEVGPKVGLSVPLRLDVQTGPTWGQTTEMLDV